MWKLLRLTRQKYQNHTVNLGRELHADLFGKWAINHELLQAGETLSARWYSTLKRPAKRHYLSDASFKAMPGYCVERRARTDMTYQRV